MRVAIRIAAAHAVLFVRPAHGANRATRREPQLLEEADGLPCDHHATGIVHRTLTHIPRINVAAHHHDLLGLFATAQLTHHVVALRIGQHLGAHLERHADLVAAVDHAAHHHGVFRRHAGVRNLRHRGVVAHAAGVRRAHAVRTRRAGQRRHGTDLGGGDGAKPTERAVVAVVAPLGVVQHDLAFGFGRALREFFKAGHHHHLGGDAGGRRGDAAAQAEHGEQLTTRRDQLQRLSAAHPMRHHHLFALHVGEAVLLHRGGRPQNGVFERLRARQAMAESIGELGDTVPGAGRVGLSGGDDAVRDLGVLGGNRLGSLRRQRGRQRGRERGGERRPCEGGEQRGANHRHIHGLG